MQLEFKNVDLEKYICQIKYAIRDMERKCVNRKDIYISIPYDLQTALGWFMAHYRPGDRPTTIFGCPIIPAYENKISIFFDEWQLANLEPIHIEIKTPVKV